AADLPANAARVPGAERRDRDGAARARVVSDDAAGRDGAREVRSAEGAGGGAGGGVVVAVVALEAQFERGVLGHFLAAVSAGSVPGAVIRAADERDNGPDGDRGDGQGREHAQREADPRGARGHSLG